MLSKEEKSKLNHQFWGEFKSLMKGKTSASNTRINWLSYPTHLKHTYLRLVFNNKEASICYDIQFRDEEIRLIFWEQLLELKNLIDNTLGSPTQWIQNIETPEGLTISRLKWHTPNLFISNKKDWKKAQKFFKDRIVEFDTFYQEYQDILINLIK